MGFRFCLKPHEELLDPGLSNIIEAEKRRRTARVLGIKGYRPLFGLKAPFKDFQNLVF